MKKLEFERQLSVSMDDGGVRVIPLVSEAVRLLAIDYRILSDRHVLTFSLHGVWTCQRTSHPFRVWSSTVLQVLKEGIGFWPSSDGSDVFVDAALGRSIIGGLKGRHMTKIASALDAAVRADADHKRGADDGVLDVSDLFAGDPQPTGFAGLLNVEDRDFGGLTVGVVSGRELHLLLSSKKFFTTWMNDNIRYLKLRVDVDYLQDRFQDADHTRTVRQYFLTEHAARGICVIDDSPGSDAVRSYLGILESASDSIKTRVRRSAVTKPDAKPTKQAADSLEQPLFPAMTVASGESNHGAAQAAGSGGSVLPVRTFQFQGFAVRVAYKGPRHWFVGSDVCLALGMARLGTAIRHVLPPDRCTESLACSRGVQRFLLLSEAAVLDIATRSIKPVSGQFFDWVRQTVFSEGAVDQASDLAVMADGGTRHDVGDSVDVAAALDVSDTDVVSEDVSSVLVDLSGPNNEADLEQFGSSQARPMFAGKLPLLERVVDGQVTKVVNGRDLHEMLLVSTHFTTWIYNLFDRLSLKADVDYVREYVKVGRHGHVVSHCLFTEAAARAIVFAVNPRQSAGLLASLRAILSKDSAASVDLPSDPVLVEDQIGVLASSESEFAAAPQTEDLLVSGADTSVPPAFVDSSAAASDVSDRSDGAEQAETDLPLVFDDAVVLDGEAVHPDEIWFGPEGDVSGELVGTVFGLYGSRITVSDVSVGPVMEFNGTRIRTLRGGGDYWFVVNDLSVAATGRPDGAPEAFAIMEEYSCFFEMAAWDMGWFALNSPGVEMYLNTISISKTKNLLSWVKEVAVPALAQMENGETVQKNMGDHADVAGGKPKEPVFLAIDYSAATMPLTMDEFLRVVGVPEAMAREEAPVREANLTLDVMGLGEATAGFRHPATGQWLFHRSVLVAWWQKAAPDVAASVRARRG